MAEQKMKKQLEQELVNSGLFTKVVRKRKPRVGATGVWNRDKREFVIEVDYRIRNFWLRRDQTVEA